MPTQPGMPNAPSHAAGPAARVAAPTASPFASSAPSGSPGALAASPAPAASVFVHSPVTTRETFWHNVVREILMALAVAADERRQAVAAAVQSGQTPPPGPADDMFDGRMGIITHAGLRIGIADITPMFACSVTGSPEQRTLATDVQCTVFQVLTPTGEVYTLPVHEIRMVHALSPELVAQLQDQARARNAAEQRSPSTTDDSNEPFGFAAFTSLARRGPQPPATPA